MPLCRLRIVQGIGTTVQKLALIPGIVADYNLNWQELDQTHSELDDKESHGYVCQHYCIVTVTGKTLYLLLRSVVTIYQYIINSMHCH